MSRSQPPFALLVVPLLLLLVPALLLALLLLAVPLLLLPALLRISALYACSKSALNTGDCAQLSVFCRLLMVSSGTFAM
jgi:hypothetical protein